MISLSSLFSRRPLVSSTTTTSNIATSKRRILNNSLIKLFLLAVTLQCLSQITLQVIILKFSQEGFKRVEEIAGVKSYKEPDISTIPVATCTNALYWSISYLFRLRSRSITLIIFQIWLLVLSIIGIFKGGLPFLSTMMVTHLILTGWAIYQTIQIHTSALLFKINLDSLACATTTAIIDQSFWKSLLIYSIPIAVFEGVGLVIIGIISYKLLPILKGYQSTPGSAGRTDPYERTTFIYRTTLLFTSFFLLTSQFTWVYTLHKNPWSASLRTKGFFLERERIYYEWFLIGLTVLVGPWTTVGYWAVGGKRKKKWVLGCVLVLNAVYVVHPAYLATQRSYFRTLPKFQFLAFLGSVGVIGGVLTFILGSMCLYGFFNDDSPPQQFVPFVPETYKFDLEKRLQQQHNPSNSLSLTIPFTSISKKTNLTSQTPVPPPSSSNCSNQGFAPSTSQLTSRPRLTSNLSTNEGSGNGNRLTRSFSLWRSRSRKGPPNPLDLELHSSSSSSSKKKKKKPKKQSGKNRKGSRKDEEEGSSSAGSSFQGISTPSTPKDPVLRSSWSSVVSSISNHNNVGGVVGNGEHRRRSSVVSMNLNPSSSTSR